MTRGTFKRRGGPAILLFAALLAISNVAFAGHWGDTTTTSFSPDFNVLSNNIVDQPTGLTLKFDQNANEDVVTKYVAHIPSGYRLSLNSIKPSTYSSCQAMIADVEGTPANINSKAEALGASNIFLSTDSSVGANVTYRGETYFLNYTPSSSTTGTATLCTYAVTTSSAITAGTANNNTRLLYQTDLTLNDDRSFDAVSSLKAVPGAVAGTHSVVDNPYFQGQHVSVLEVLATFNSSTIGNYNTDPGTGAKKKVPFAFTPVSVGTYDFVGTAYPCGSQTGDPVLCNSSASAATIVRSVGISSAVTGIHGIPVITSPAILSGIGTQPYSPPIFGSSVDIKWNALATGVNESIKGYLVTTGVPYQPDLIHFDYLVTNPADPGYVAANDPCAPDGTASSCKLTIHFPLLTTDGRTMPGNGLYSTSLVAIFMDGHRSDGLCDNGTGPGYKAPCADGSMPQFTPPGFTSRQYIIRAKQWPLTFVQLFTHQDRGKSGSQWTRVDQIWFLFADLDNHQAEFVIEKPYGTSFPMSAGTIIGVNDGPLGVINFLDNTNNSGKRFAIQAEVDPILGVNGNFIQFLNSYTPSPDFSPLNLGMSQL